MHLCTVANTPRFFFHFLAIFFKASNHRNIESVMFHARRGVVIQPISYPEPLRMHVNKDFMHIKRPLYWKKKTFKQKRSIYNKINAEVISKTNAKLTKKWNIATIFLH